MVPEAQHGVPQAVDNPANISQAQMTSELPHLMGMRSQIRKLMVRLTVPNCVGTMTTHIKVTGTLAFCHACNLTRFGAQSVGTCLGGCRRSSAASQGLEHKYMQ